eukprot:TRINITY_DN40295_c0_g1_i1.p1 TRINITY_DN40295_c0_g1~~TRINITY_DN40295_c0_g1_i1.p1  ORF type:complete len:386 (+),score=68.02 TRINITY_DN40295_c0_g1_i1:68-1159(+)
MAVGNAPVVVGSLIVIIGAVCLGVTHLRETVRTETGRVHRSLSAVLDEMRQENTRAAEKHKKSLEELQKRVSSMNVQPPPAAPVARIARRKEPLPVLPASLLAKSATERLPDGRVKPTCLHSMDVPVKLGNEEQDALAQKHSSLGGMAPSQYRHIMRRLMERAPADVLVFSVGNDSPLWKDLNVKGRTVFAEDIPGWAEKVKEKMPDIHIELVNYTVNAGNCRRDIAAIKSGSVDAVRDTDLPLFRRKFASYKWRLILVDGPSGFTRGRVQASVTALISACNTVRRHGGTVSVFLHDCERSCEALISTNLLKEITACQVWPRSEVTGGGQRPQNADITLHQFEISRDSPACAHPGVQAALKNR